MPTATPNPYFLSKMAAYFPPYVPSNFSFYHKHRLDIQYSYYVFNAETAKDVHQSWREDWEYCDDGDGHHYQERVINYWVDDDYAALLKRFKNGDRIYFGDANYLWILKEAQEFLPAFEPHCVHCHKACHEKSDPENAHTQCEMKALVALGWKTHREW
jgi:hypothetical protein